MVKIDNYKRWYLICPTCGWFAPFGNYQIRSSNDDEYVLQSFTATGLSDFTPGGGSFFRCRVVNERWGEGDSDGMFNFFIIPESINASPLFYLRIKGQLHGFFPGRLPLEARIPLPELAPPLPPS